MPRWRRLRKRVDTPPEPANSPHAAVHLEPKYLETLEHNQKINGCCRRPEESGHIAQWFYSPSAETTPGGTLIPDILIIRCGACDRRHIRVMGGGGTRKIIQEVR